MFMLMNPPHKKRRKKSKGRKKLSIFTAGGGRIFAANRRKRFNSFLGINPRRAFPAIKGANVMAKRRSRGRHVRFNLGSIAKVFSGKASTKSPLGGLSVGGVMGVAPMIGGVVGNGLVTALASKHIPYTKKGIGAIGLGLATAGLLKWATTAVSKNAKLGNSVFIGAVVGTFGCAVQAFQQGGLKSLSLSDDLEGWDGEWAGSMNGLGTFITPQAIQGAFPADGTMSQYALPNTNAQFMPGQTMQMPQTPAQGAHARHMSDYEGSAIGAMLGQNDDGASMM